MNFFFKYTIKSFFVFVYNLLLSPFSKAARHKLSAVYLTLQYPFFGPGYTDLSSLLKNDNLRVDLAPLKAGMHNVDAFELLSICSILKDNNAKRVFEIGTYDGRTTMSMSLNLGEGNNHIYTLNLPPETATVQLDTSVVDVQLAKKVISGERFLNTPLQNKITQLWGDSATFDFTPYYDSIDFVFIDGAHSESYVKKDTETAMQLIKKSGGIIAWHDAHLFGVVKFLQPWISTNKLPVYFIRNTSIAIAKVKDGVIIDLLSN